MQNFDEAMEQARQYAATPQGRQLAAILQQLGTGDPQHALDRAAAGDMTQAKQIISALMSHPEARKLLEAMGGSHGEY